MIRIKSWTLGLIAFVTLSVFIVVFASVLRADEPEPDSAQAAVSYLQQSLLQAMREGEQLNYSERVEFLTPVVDQTHDIDLIIKTILGATLWLELDASQQNLIIETFRQLSIATYAGRFKQYSGEQFKFIEQRDLPRGQQLVRSQLIKGDGGTVNFDYVLHRPAEHWLIINILFDGVSDLAIKRSEYRSILQREGFQSLIDMLNVKIAEAEHSE
ncbi:ABC transporter substrate-binding protein [Nitrosomonas sp.]|uniref:ABC transporter substrate-binding protein n=1 Tax=Nitrosomonas sp. TaxID=42353 RepID=UPI001D86B4AA|nr:ABC transporter substrate-binding protein [Nitrosomonas sp.]MCB1947450.1 ABC transporter substrate-binding protein [Nitrosomonas sp.]MCP5244010.1 ABC transporter substrate-binding protein [Burkholderiales bacterium]MDR4514320.1 ABC transporter substrate-binding protein [Nitrosomonas sp.]